MSSTSRRLFHLCLQPCGAIPQCGCGRRHCQAEQGGGVSRVGGKAGGINPPAVAGHQPFEINCGQQGHAAITFRCGIAGWGCGRGRPDLILRIDGGTHFQLVKAFNARAGCGVHGVRVGTLISLWSRLQTVAVQITALRPSGQGWCGKKAKIAFFPRPV